MWPVPHCLVGLNRRFAFAAVSGAVCSEVVMRLLTAPRRGRTCLSHVTRARGGGPLRLRGGRRGPAPCSLWGTVVVVGGGVML